MHELYEIKEKLMKELEEYGSQEMSAGSLEVIDKLAHAIKNICKIIEAYEEEEGYSEEGGRGGNYRYSYEGGRERERRYSYEGGQGGGGRGGGGSYARGGGRGRGRNARRDSMGRYSSDGYSRAEDDMDSMIMELREMMGDLPQEKQKEVQRFIQKIEQM